MRYFILLTALLMAMVGCSQQRTVAVTDEATGLAQVVYPMNDSLYQGHSPDCSYVLLYHDDSEGWLLTVYDYADVSSPMYPSATFGQVTPDAGNPAGAYGRLVNGKPNPDAAQFRVSVGSE